MTQAALAMRLGSMHAVSHDAVELAPLTVLAAQVSECLSIGGADVPVALQPGDNPGVALRQLVSAVSVGRGRQEKSVAGPELVRANELPPVAAHLVGFDPMHPATMCRHCSRRCRRPSLAHGQ